VCSLRDDTERARRPAQSPSWLKISAPHISLKSRNRKGEEQIRKRRVLNAAGSRSCSIAMSLRIGDGHVS